MDCIDCHNQATHVFQTAEDAVDEAMLDGNPSPELPFMHKEALQLIQATYASQAEAGAILILVDRSKSMGVHDLAYLAKPEEWGPR